METRGFLLNERTDGMMPLKMELVRTKSSLLMRLPDQNVVISVHLDDVKIVLDEIPLV